MNTGTSGLLRIVLLVAGCVSLETCEQILYRFAGRIGGRGRKYWTRIAPAIAAHIARLCLWYLLLSALPLGEAVPLLGINFLMVALAGRLIFRERIDARRWLGTALVIAGFVMVAARLD